jgi:hypothetical protein
LVHGADQRDGFSARIIVSIRLLLGIARGFVVRLVSASLAADGAIAVCIAGVRQRIVQRVAETGRPILARGPCRLGRRSADRQIGNIEVDRIHRRVPSPIA